MRNTISAFLTAICLAVPLAAHADTTTTFNLNGFTFQSGATATGNITIDVTSGQFVAGDITYVGSSTYLFNGAFQDQASLNGNQYYGDLYTLPAMGGVDFDFDLPVASLVGYAGGAVCTASVNCPGGLAGGLTANGVDYDYFTAGSLVAATSPVPEPSSLLMFGTGLLGAVGAVRRRFVS
jgi:hypothetical protein